MLSGMSDASRVVNSAFLSVAAKLLGKTLGLFSTFIVARILTPEDFGFIAIVSMALYLFDILSHAAGEQYIVQKRSVGYFDLHTAWSFNLLLKLIIALVIMVCANGIAAFQMDIKVEGITKEIMAAALNQAKEGRLHILTKITDTIAAPNAELKPQTPRIEAFTVPNDMIGAIIGPGGKIIQQMQKDTNTNITIEELESGEGKVQIMSNNADDMNAAVKMIKQIAFPPTVDEGAEYEGKIKSLQAYGVFVEIVPGTDGLIHISEFAHERIQKMEDVCKEGDVVKFKVVGKDPKTRKTAKSWVSFIKDTAQRKKVSI